MASARQLTPVHAQPNAAAEQVTQVLAGEPVRVLEARGGWLRIETAYGYPGWVREDALGETDDPEWLARLTDDAVANARAYLGAPYEWGGMTEGGIDCSGLVHMAYRRTGRLVPRDAHEQEAAAEPITERDALAGDVVCFGPAERADHIAFWLGDGRVLHASSRAGGVVEEPFDPRGAPYRFARL